MPTLYIPSSSLPISNPHPRSLDSNGNDVPRAAAKMCAERWRLLRTTAESHALRWRLQRNLEHWKLNHVFQSYLVNKGPWWFTVYRGWTTTQLHGDYKQNENQDPYCWWKHFPNKDFKVSCHGIESVKSHQLNKSIQVLGIYLLILLLMEKIRLTTWDL